MNALPTPRASSDHGDRHSTSVSPSRRVKRPSYDAATLHIHPPSPLLTSSLHSRRSASSAQESRYLAHVRYLSWAGLVLTGLIVAAATAAAGCAGHILSSYNRTHLGREWQLPLWPVDVDVRPTLAVLIVAALVLAGSLAYLVVSLLPTPHSRTTLCNLVLLATALAGVTLCLFALPFDAILSDPATHQGRESLQSWTCRLSHGAATFTADVRSLQLPVFLADGMPVPAGFKRLCMESQVGARLLIAVLVLELAAGAVATAGIAVAKSIEHARKQRYALAEKPDQASQA